MQEEAGGESGPLWCEPVKNNQIKQRAEKLEREAANEQEWPDGEKHEFAIYRPQKLFSLL